MKKQMHGQSLLEYSMIAVIVLLAIMVGGPILTSSVQNYFRMMNSSVQDSFKTP